MANVRPLALLTRVEIGPRSQFQPTKKITSAITATNATRPAMASPDTTSQRGRGAVVVDDGAAAAVWLDVLDARC